MDTYNSKALLVISGDHSADMYVAKIIEEIKKKTPDLKIAGTGGDKMKDAGMELLWHLNDISVIGLWEALYKVNIIKKVKKSLIDYILNNNVSAALLVDYPGFNLYFANILKKMHIPVIYFISPQIWAWRSGRIKKIKERVDKMLVILPFEEAMYRRSGLDTEFVGHPLMEIMNAESSVWVANPELSLNFLTEKGVLYAHHRDIEPSSGENDIYKSINFERFLKEINDGYKVALLPGSRKKEIEYLIEDMLRAAELVSEKIKNVSFILPLAQGLDINLIKKHLAGKKISMVITDGRARNVMKISDFAVICSGTATLEAAITETPFIIIYKLSKLTEIVGKRFLKIKNWGLVNIVAGKEIIPELQQEEVNPENIASAVLEALKSPGKLIETKEELVLLKNLLGSADVSKRVADVILQYI